MRFTGWFVDEGAGFGNPVMLQVPPVTAHRKPTNDANVVVHAELGARQTFEDNAEPTGRYVEAAGLNPDAIRVRHPRTIISQVGIDNIVPPVSPIGIKPICRIVESCDSHLRTSMQIQD